MDAVLQAESVAYSYPQDGHGFAQLSFSLAAGEILHISGSSGSGKSTLARCLTGLIPHLYHGQLEGVVWVCNHRTDQAPLWQISQAAGMVFQNPASQMLAPTVADEIIFGLENLGLPVAEIDSRMEQVLVDFGLAAMRKRSPLTLSGGEQQKLALAAVMSRRPPLLVLDEPLSMLDTTSAFDLVDRLAELASQRTTVAICEHRREYVERLPGLRLLSLDGFPEVADVAAEITWPGSEKPALRLEAVDIQVARGGKLILDGWDFNLEGGQLTAVVGRNGVGKTTLFRALAGLQPFTGQLGVLAGDRVEPPQLGMVFQNPDLQLFNPTVREEILYGLPEADLSLYSWLARVLDLQRYENTPPLLLSEGEKRRVALATILMRQPEHGLLLDEPALGQDTAHKAMLVCLLRGLAAKGQIVAYATHDVELALQADRLVLLGPQGILVSGSPRDLLQKQEYWQQAGLRLPDWIAPAC